MKLYLTLITSFLLFSLQNISAQQEETITEGLTIQAPPAPLFDLTTIEFEEPEHHFGTIEQDEKVIHTFIFKNTGDAPLVISKAKGSCGCTVPFWPKEPILSGETGEIEVKFDSKGKKGKQSKRITITTNTDPPQSFLTIKGEINAPAEKEAVHVLDTGATHGVSPESVKTIKIETPDATQPFYTPGADFKPADCFAIYPNPTAEILNLDVKDHIGESAMVTIYTNKGVVVASEKIKAISESVVTFDVQDYPAGTYYANIRIGGHAPATKCFVIAK